MFSSNIKSKTCLRPPHVIDLRFSAVRADKGFSLIEIAIAIGIFAFAILIILGLFASLTKDSIQSKNDTQIVGLTGSIDSYIREEGSSSGVAAAPYLYFNIDSGFLINSATPLATLPFGAYYQVYIKDASPGTASPRHRVWKVLISYPLPAISTFETILVSQPLFK